MIVVIDTREQRPWGFPPAVYDHDGNAVEQVTQEIGTLKTGDYALKGDDHFAVERKSGDDFLGTVSSGWHRFCRELNRMDEAGFAAKVVIVESDYETFCYRIRQGAILPPDHQHVRCTPQFVMKRIAQLTMRGVSVIFAGTSEHGAALALRILVERQDQLHQLKKKEMKCR